MASPLLTALERDGYVIIPSILSPAELSLLRMASSETVSLARSGDWPHVRTIPKQFPPWGRNPFFKDVSPPSQTDDLFTPSSPAPPPAKGIWGVQHLLSPALPHSQAFVQAYFHPKILATVQNLLRTPTTPCPPDVLVLELFNMLIRPDTSFALRWHRDDIPFSCSLEDEAARLAAPAWHAQYNLALYDDESLIVVPGSHTRPRSVEECEVLERDLEGLLPGQVVVGLRAGDAVFYDNNVLHRGIYDEKIERMTLHGSVGHVGGSETRARNVLQHGVGEWVADCDFGCLDGERRELAEGMRKRLVEMGCGKGEVGFSLEG